LLGAVRHGRIVVCGEVDAQLPHIETITVTGPQNFTKVLQLMDNAKLIVNAMQYRDGAHERVFYGLSRGAAILSDSSRFLAEAEATRAGVVFFPENPAVLDDTVARLIASPLDDTVAEGRRWYADRHTWDHRAAQLLDLVTPLF
jgi:hypothetical protein